MMKNDIIDTIDLPKIFDPRGSLTVTEENIHVPFHLGHIEWWYGMEAGSNLTTTNLQYEIMIVALSGSFIVEVQKETSKCSTLLNHPYQAILIHKGTSYQLKDCSNGTVALLLCSV